MSRKKILWSLLLFLIAFLTFMFAIIGINRMTSEKAVEDPDANLLFGAIARSQNTGMLGYASKLGSREEAEQKAVEVCGNDCVIISWFQNACGAYAAGLSNWGAHFGVNVEESMLKATETCVAQSPGSNCKVKLVVCSNGFVSKNQSN